MANSKLTPDEVRSLLPASMVSGVGGLLAALAAMRALVDASVWSYGALAIGTVIFVAGNLSLFATLGKIIAAKHSEKQRR